VCTRRTKLCLCTKEKERISYGATCDVAGVPDILRTIHVVFEASPRRVEKEKIAAGVPAVRHRDKVQFDNQSLLKICNVTCTRLIINRQRIIGAGVKERKKNRSRRRPIFDENRRAVGVVDACQERKPEDWRGGGKRRRGSRQSYLHLSVLFSRTVSLTFGASTYC